MIINSAIIVLVMIIALVWIFIGTNKTTHKILAIFLIILILFTYITFFTTIQNKEIDLKTPSGIIYAGKIYFSWLGTIFQNTKSITAYASQQDWNPKEVSPPKNLSETYENLEISK